MLEVDRWLVQWRIHRQEEREGWTPRASSTLEVPAVQHKWNVKQNIKTETQFMTNFLIIKILINEHNMDCSRFKRINIVYFK